MQNWFLFKQKTLVANFTMSTIAHEEFIPHLTLTVGAPESILKSKGFLSDQHVLFIRQYCHEYMFCHGFYPWSLICQFIGVKLINRRNDFYIQQFNPIRIMLSAYVTTLR